MKTLVRLCLIFLLLAPAAAQTENGKLGSSIANTIAASVWNRDDDYVKRILTESLIQNDLLAIEFQGRNDEATVAIWRGKDGAVVATADKAVPGEIAQQAAARRTHPVTYEGKELGQLILFARPKTSSLRLTAEEQAWLIAHPVIRVSNETDYPPYDFAVGGQPQGFSIELLNLLAQKMAIKVDYVTGPTWAQMLQMHKDGKLDLLHSLTQTPEREKVGLFSESYIRLRTTFVTRQGEPDLAGFEQLEGKTVAVAKGWAQDEFLASKYPGIKRLVVANLEEMLEAVSTGKADATLENEASVQYWLRKKGLTDLKLAGWAQQFDQGQVHSFRFYARKNAPELVSMLNKALASLTPGELQSLQEKWFGKTNSRADANDANGVKAPPHVTLTEQERSYLTQKGAIKMCVLPDWLPYERINDKGLHEGISADMIELMGQRLGVKFELHPTKAWSESLEAIRARQCDILPIATDLPSRRDAMNFTRPYIFEPLVIVTRADELFIKDLGDIRERKLGIVQHYSYFELLQRKQPNLTLVPVKNIQDGLERVRSGELWGYVDALTTVGYLLQKNAMVDLKISGKTEIELENSAAARSDEPLLAGILQKAIDSVTEDERRALVNKWVSLRFEQEFDYARYWKFFAGAALLLLAVIFWNRHLARLNRKLDRTQAELQHALLAAQTALHAAEDANNMKSEFLAMISHEVRTPLGGIMGMLRIGIKDARVPGDTRGRLNVGLANAEMLLQIINDILDYSKLAAGKMSLEVIDFDLPTVVRDAQAILNDRAEAKGLSLVVEVDESLPVWWRGDPARLRQVLINLIGNAIKFTAKGEARLTVSRADDDDGGGGGAVVFSLRDTGIGISAEALPRLFQKFEQADAATTRKFGGTGLGLAICKLIVDAMGGTIGVDSQLGVGTTFTVRLPLLPGVSTTAHAEAAMAAHSHRLNILCAEDGATNQIIIRELVEAMGHTIDIAGDGVAVVEALAASAAHGYDMVLMDSRMPMRDGLEALRLIREGAEGVRDAAIPVVALTANVGVEESARFFAAGADGFLGKPIDEVALHVEIARMIALLIERGKTLPLRQEGIAEASGLAALDAMFGVDEGVSGAAPVAAAIPAASTPQSGFSDKAKLAMRQAFLTEAPRLLAVVQAGLAAGDGPAIALAAHSLKGSAGYFGADALTELCRQIEAAADAGDLALIRSKMDAFGAAVHSAVADS